MQEDRRPPIYLKKVDLLSELSADKIRSFASGAEVEEARRRHVFYMSGDPGDQVYFIAQGRVKISRVTRDGKELTLAYRNEGEIFGELCLVDGGPRQEMAEAMEACQVVVTSRDAFDDLLKSNASVAYRFGHVTSARRLELEAKVEDLVFKDVNAKLAELLLQLGDDHGVKESRGVLLGVKITHQEMANLIGSTRETVSLTLSQFKKNGLIDNDGRKVILVDQEGLKALI